MFVDAYSKALSVIAKKPIVLWGLSLLSGLITIICSFLFIGVPAVSIGISFIITCGMAKVYLDGLGGKEVYADQLFSGFNKNCFRIAGGMAWQTLWIVIWALVPIVGPIIAIIKAYSYRFVPYILITHPEVNATQALKLSMMLTNGLKGQMFLADLCFGLGLGIIALILTALAAIPFIGIIFAIVAFVFYVLVAVFFAIFQGLYRAYFFAIKESN